MNLTPSQLKQRATVLLASGAASGQSASAHSPSIDVFGSYFPAWMICMLTGLALALISRQIFIALRIDRHLHPAPIVYASLTALFTMMAWLALFQN